MAIQASLNSDNRFEGRQCEVKIDIILLTGTVNSLTPQLIVCRNQTLDQPSIIWSSSW